MYNFKILTAAIVMAATASVAQAVEVGGSIGYVSDYVFRGISQNDEDGALQGGLNLDFDSGWYVGVWGSEVNMGEEFDFTAGYRSSFDVYDSDLNYGIGLTQYTYTDDDFAEDYTELNVFLETQLGQRPSAQDTRRKARGTLGIAVNYSPEVFQAYGDDVTYTNAKVYYETPEYSGFTGHASYGYSEYDFSGSSMYVSIDDSWTYADWNIGVDKTWNVNYGDIVINVDYYDTDIDDVYLADDRVVAGIRFEF